MFGQLRKDLETIDSTSSFSGTVIHHESGGKPILVALLRLEREEVKEISAYWVLLRPVPFTFRAVPGNYQLWAIEDANEDFLYQNSEYIGWYGLPSIVRVATTRTYRLYCAHPSKPMLSFRT